MSSQKQLTVDVSGITTPLWVDCSCGELPSWLKTQPCYKSKSSSFCWDCLHDQFCDQCWVVAIKVFKAHLLTVLLWPSLSTFGVLHIKHTHNVTINHQSCWWLRAIASLLHQVGTSEDVIAWCNAKAHSIYLPTHHCWFNKSHFSRLQMPEK